MHDIVGDTDMYVGVGSKKSEEDEDPMSAETLYHYVNPDDPTQVILAAGPSFNTGDTTITKQLGGTSGTNSNAKQQYFEYNPETKEFRTMEMSDGVEVIHTSQFVTTEYVVAATHTAPTTSIKLEADTNDGIILELNDGSDSQGDSSIINNSANTIKSSNFKIEKHSNSDRNFSNKKINSRKFAHFSSILNSSSNNCLGSSSSSSSSIEPKQNKIESSISCDLQDVLTTGLVLDESVLGRGVVLEEGVEVFERDGGHIFEDTIQLGHPNDQAVIEIEMADASNLEDNKFADEIEIQCDGSIESFVDGDITVDSLSKFENDSALFEISEADFSHSETGYKSEVKNAAGDKDQKTFSIAKDGRKKLKVFHHRSPTNR